jgi:hypothetical protein
VPANNSMRTTLQQAPKTTEPTHALAVRHQAIITLVVILLLFAGREFRGATRLAGHLLQDNDQLTVSAELESNDLTSVNNQALIDHMAVGE